jgi:hypothetical protein
MVFYLAWLKKVSPFHHILQTYQLVSITVQWPERTLTTIIHLYLLALLVRGIEESSLEARRIERAEELRRQCSRNIPSSTSEQNGLKLSP